MTTIGLIHTHTKSKRGYLSRKNGATKIERVTNKGKYNGLYRNCSPRWDTTQYIYVHYYRPARENEKAENYVEVE